MAVVEAGAVGPGPVPAAAAATSVIPPMPDHIVIVMLENKRYDAVVGHPKTPWVSSLARTSANMLHFYAETHPSQPNYLALFSGSPQGVSDNNCPHELGSRPNLARQLLDARHTFTGYSENLPGVGWRGCADKGYVRRHTPWVNFSNVPASANQPYTAFPTNYHRLPTVSFVIPNLCHDMHDCPKGRADSWLRKQFAPYVAWARTHNSLFILTFDEDNKTDHNHIPTIIAGAGVRPGQYGAHLNHYDLLRTLQRMYRLPVTGAAVRRKGLPDIWTSA
ncbi:alkaline phosphatase family protein [Couchioplanes caeruleus]|uniref:alkaline phosphatase family protein n=1 Tax=Couchioplanes caeruleus TaxID=56438 RepID=UPI0020BDBE8E|nr:alkaline phosphatase family protein [Couchioplanes caeruleus]UQU67620.1 alkaline phosphatase family protein [Couchioplanes caeruleus]